MVPGKRDVPIHGYDEDVAFDVDRPLSESALSRAGAEIERAHREKLRLCAALEDVADSLPAHVDRLRCLAIAGELVPLLRSVHRYEEDVVLPAFLAALGRSPDAWASVVRLKTEHVEDECFADELTEVLMAIGQGGRVDNPEATGFMLRGFFETLRRHIAFEREHVLPAILTSRRL